MIYSLMTAHGRPDHPAQHMFRWLRVTLSWSVRGRGGHGSFGFTPAASSSVDDDVAPFAAPSAPCALPGSWSGQVPLELAREVTLHRGFIGARRQAHTHIFTSGLNHWRSEAAHPRALRPHVGGKALPNCTRPRGSRLAFLILVSRVVLCTILLLSMVSVHRHQSGRWAASPGHLPASTLAQAPGLAKTSLSALDIRSAGNANHALQLLPAHTYLSCRLKVALGNPMVLGLVGLESGHFAALYGVCCVVRAVPLEGPDSGSEALAAIMLIVATFRSQD